jgi:hypothetical protein
MDANKPAPQGHGIAVEPDRVSTRIIVTFGVAVVLMALAARARHPRCRACRSTRSSTGRTSRRPSASA